MTTGSSGREPAEQRPGQIEHLLLKQAEVVALAEQLRSTLARVRSGELTASTAFEHRLEGAVTALDAVLGNPTSLLEGVSNEPAL